MKQCKYCGIRLIFKNTYRPHYCKKCHSAYQQKWYKIPKNRKKVLAYDENRRQKLRQNGHHLWIAKTLRTYKKAYKKLNLPNISPSGVIKLAKQLEKDLSKAVICPYTGLKIGPGSISLDHCKPISKYPKLAYKHTNLQWVHRSYNLAKNNMTNQEFLCFCRKIVKIANKKQASERKPRPRP